VPEEWLESRIIPGRVPELRWFETPEDAKATIEDWQRNYNEATRVDLTRLSTTWRQLNLYAGRAFQALPRA
jgi:hypothetical protein